MDQDRAFMSSLMNYLFKKVNIKIKLVAPFNHQLLQAEHGIKSLSTILTKHLTELSQMWPKYLPLATVAYNSSSIQNLANYSHYELDFSRKPNYIEIKNNLDIMVLRIFKDFYTLLNTGL